MIKKVEHIGLAVKNLEQSKALFAKILGKAPYKDEQVASEQVGVSFFETGESKIELLEAKSDLSAIQKFIEKRGEGMHHIAFETDDILAEIERLKKEGFQFISETPKKGADGKLVVFLHPKSTGGVLIEFCQDASK